MARRRRTSSARSSSAGRGTTAIVIAQPRPPAYMTPSAPSRVQRVRGAIVQRGGQYVRRRGGLMGTAKRVAGLSVGGALGSAIQGTLQGLGVGPVMSKLAVVGAGVFLGSGAQPGSVTDAGTDGMIASAGAGAIFDLVAWWKSRGYQQRPQQPQQPAQQPAPSTPKGQQG